MTPQSWRGRVAPPWARPSPRSRPPRPSATRGGRRSVQDRRHLLGPGEEIATAEQARPGSSSELLQVASDESFQVLRDKARTIVLEAQQTRGLAERQHHARSARSYRDRLGMVNLNLVLEPHVGTPIVNRAEAEAARLYRKAKEEGRYEPFERHLADAYAGMLSGALPRAALAAPSWWCW